MKFCEAIKCLEEGKQIRISNWPPHKRLAIWDDFICFETNEPGKMKVVEGCRLKLSDIESKDWEIYEEPKVTILNRNLLKFKLKELFDLLNTVVDEVTK